MKLFVDTWGWIALGDKNDNDHYKVNTFYNNFIEREEEIITTDYILTETITLLFTKVHFTFARDFINGIFKNVNEGIFNIEFISHERFKKAWDLRLRFNDKPKISFTDFTSFVVMDEFGIKDVLTGDVHFEIVNMGFKKIL